jgi:hypothetical protein
VCGLNTANNDNDNDKKNKYGLIIIGEQDNNEEHGALIMTIFDD